MFETAARNDIIISRYRTRIEPRLLKIYQTLYIVLGQILTRALPQIKKILCKLIFGLHNIINPFRIGLRKILQCHFNAKFATKFKRK